MTFPKKLFGQAEVKTLTRVCVECGMPIKDWCSILRTQQEMDQKLAQKMDQKAAAQSA